MKYKEIEKMHQDGFKIIDIRKPEELEATPKLEFADHIDRDELLKHYNENYANKDEKIAVVCRAGRRSQEVCDILQSQGFTNVKNIDEGMTGIEK